MSMLPRRLSAEDDVDAKKKKMIGAGWIKPGVRSVQERLAELRLEVEVEVEVEVGLLSRYSILSSVKTVSLMPIMAQRATLRSPLRRTSGRS